MSYDNIEYDPFYIFAQGAIDDSTDLTTLTYSASVPASTYDWSGVAVDNDTTVRRKSLGALITPLHMACAIHNGGTGNRKWIASDGTLYERSVTILGDITTVDAPYTDLRILELSSPLPSTCKVYSVLTNADRLGGYGVLSVEQAGDVIMTRVYYVSAASTFALCNVASWQGLVFTASGNPLFATINNELYFIKTHTTASCGTKVGDFIPEINSLISSSGYTVSTFDCPIFPTPIDTSSFPGLKLLPLIGR